MTAYLRQYVTDARADKIGEVLDRRTRFLTVVMEDFENPHNGSAVLRSCEAMGVQDVHFIENKFRNKVSPYVARGGAKWLSIYRHNQPEKDNTTACLADMKGRGYSIWVTDTDRQSTDLRSCEPSGKVALVFGTEHGGVSAAAKRLADETVFFPMQGFTESYNVSVSVALCVYVLLEKLKTSDMEWHLTEEEKKQLTLEWYRKVVRRSEAHEARFFAGK